MLLYYIFVPCTNELLFTFMLLLHTGEYEAIQAEAGHRAISSPASVAGKEVHNNSSYNASDLCSHSYKDMAKRGKRAASRPNCYDCLRGTGVSFSVPGGAACCPSQGDLSRCPRVWTWGFSQTFFCLFYYKLFITEIPQHQQTELNVLARFLEKLPLLFTKLTLKNYEIR